MNADGNIADEEIDFVFQLGIRMGLSEEQIKELLSDYKNNEYKTPVSISRRYAELYELLGMVVVDGTIHKNEVKVLKSIAQKLGFKPEIIDKTLESLMDFIHSNFHSNNLKNDFSSFFKTV